MSKTVRLVITGAAGQIGYSVIPLFCSGQVFGLDTHLILHLLDVDVEVVQKSLRGIAMEITDCAYPLVKDVVTTSDVKTAFSGVQVAVLVGGFPRKAGMERKDLLSKNSPIFVTHGTALNDYADPNVKVLVVANPANSNCLVAQRHAPKISPLNFSCLTRLDQNRATAQIAAKLNVSPLRVKDVVIWGNHSATMVPDASRAKILGDKKSEGSSKKKKVLPISKSGIEEKWLKGEFVSTVQQRGAKVIEARGNSSAFSAAKAIADHVHDWWLGSEDHVISMGVISDGSYGITKNIIFSFPVITQAGGTYKIVQDLSVEGYESLLKKTEQELVDERTDVDSILASSSS